MSNKGETQHPTAYILCAFALVFTAVIGIYGVVNRNASNEIVLFPNASMPRRLLISPNITAQDYGDLPDRIGVGGEMQCSKDSILVFQGQTTPLPNGIPTYTVDIENVCISDSCSISNIHLSCGWFSSARTINPAVFRRLNYDDCLVNDGQPLYPGQTVSFQYAETYKYPLAVSSVSC
ncbi:TPD1 protein homolog 1-like [Salvia splendens]|uniref:TPD1 protein homolog 1-like n=1 Tax=Salvia splendens TaxID=180675 RepID=UPI001C26D7BD|nr:TPD1 protein homolog 1-like [Salvia splendens]